MWFMQRRKVGGGKSLLTHGSDGAEAGKGTAAQDLKLTDSPSEGQADASHQP